MWLSCTLGCFVFYCVFCGSVVGICFVFDGMFLLLLILLFYFKIYLNVFGCIYWFGCCVVRCVVDSFCVLVCGFATAAFL